MPSGNDYHGGTKYKQLVHLGKESLWDSCVNLATFLLESYWNVILKEWNNVICSNMDGPGHYHTQ